MGKKLNIGIINGPNLNLLGKREPEIYGSTSFETFLIHLKSEFNSIDLDYFQSNIEGELVNQLQKWSNKDGIILNAAAYTHTSVAIADAIAAISAEVIEVHISNPASREVERHTSLISKYCKGSISGLGMQSYFHAILFLKNDKSS